MRRKSLKGKRIREEEQARHLEREKQLIAAEEERLAELKRKHDKEEFKSGKRTSKET